MITLEDNLRNVNASGNPNKIETIINRQYLDFWWYESPSRSQFIRCDLSKSHMEKNHTPALFSCVIISVVCCVDSCG